MIGQANIDTGIVSTLNATVREAYENDLKLNAKSNEVIKFEFNPLSDDFKSVCEWLSGEHLVPNSSELYLEIPNGLHSLNTYFDLKDSNKLTIKGTDTPDSFIIQSAEISETTTNYIYQAVIGISSELPSYVEVGYAIGLQNVRGNNGAEALTGGHIIESIASDRKSFIIKFRAYGVVPTTPTSFTTGTTLGLLESRVIVPKCCIRANNSGWDGSSREGFLNVLENSLMILENIGISYNGLTDSHDLLFVSKKGYLIGDNCVFAGAGSRTIRGAYSGIILFSNSCLGVGTTGTDVFQGASNVNLDLVRCSVSGGNVSTLTATDNTNIFITQSLICGGVHQLRTTYDTSNITVTNSRVVNGYYGASASKGKIYFDSACVIKNHFKAIYQNGGVVTSSATLDGNLN